MRKTVLLFHQGGGLYGSDKIFLSIVASLSEKYAPVVVLDQKGPLVRELKKFTKTIYIREMGALRRKKNIIKTVGEFVSSLFYINKLINRYKPVACATNTSILLGGALVSKFKKVKHIWFVHECPPGFSEQRLLRFWINIFSDRVVVPSRSVKEWVGEPAEIIPYVEKVKRTDKKKSERIRRGFGKDGNIILGCVGMLHPKKGQMYLVDILEKIIQKRKDIRLVIIGGEVEGYESYKANLQKSVNSKNLREFVIFEDFKRNILTWMEAFDAIIIPSQYKEPFPLVAQEAMFIGRPIIATELGGLKELIKRDKNGIFIPHNDSEKAARAILKFIQDKNKLSRLGKEGRKIYEKNFNFFEFKARIKSLFD